MMYLLTGAFVAWPGWEDLMTRHKDDITLQRLAHGTEILRDQLCTEFEAMLYLSTASLAQPISHNWYEIYMWLFRRWNPEGAKSINLEERELYQTQVEDLNRLRRWIFRTQMDRLRQRLRSTERSEEGKEVEASKPEQVIQPQMFNFESSEEGGEGE
jgi:hypothetical protein